MNKKLKKIILKPMDILYKIAPKLEVKIMFFLKHRYMLNEKNPITYNEKINWMKINYRNNKMIQCADKFAVREYIDDKGFSKYLPKLLWDGYDPSKIPFNELPDKFVIKVTHGAGNNIICTDKTKLNKRNIVNKLHKCLKKNI